MKIYTRTGDKGETGLFGAGRVSKASLRVEAYGEVDETNSHIGLVRSFTKDRKLSSMLGGIQADLFVLGSDLATPLDSPSRKKVPKITARDIKRLEKIIDQVEGELEPLRKFVLPAGSQTASLLHVARTVCRRAERRIVALKEKEEVNEQCLIYLNRLSDLLFVLARLANKRAKVRDVEWELKKLT
ncbi:MAG: cob(I)yrinic acid a,c-diamide adenosyltransferase [Thaumarchaeota archaeon]|nr:cob(I)yrinic acid a,c-diamide adenosyltransferase [Nitrososphaerota archaeon]